MFFFVEEMVTAASMRIERNPTRAQCTKDPHQKIQAIEALVGRFPFIEPLVRQLFPQNRSTTKAAFPKCKFEIETIE